MPADTLDALNAARLRVVTCPGTSEPTSLPRSVLSPEASSPRPLSARAPPSEDKVPADPVSPDRACHLARVMTVYRAMRSSGPRQHRGPWAGPGEPNTAGGGGGGGAAGHRRSQNSRPRGTDRRVCSRTELLVPWDQETHYSARRALRVCTRGVSAAGYCCRGLRAHTLQGALGRAGPERPQASWERDPGCLLQHRVTVCPKGAIQGAAGTASGPVWARTCENFPVPPTAA